MHLRRPTADTGAIVQAAVLGLQAIYRPGFNYAKAGVMLMDLQPDCIRQGELELGDEESLEDMAENMRLMSALDAINQRYGKGTMKMASSGLDGDRRVWSMRQERRTPGYTTDWAGIPVART
jgi:DNA polymerase V